MRLVGNVDINDAHLTQIDHDIGGSGAHAGDASVANERLNQFNVSAESGTLVLWLVVLLAGVAVVTEPKLLHSRTIDLTTS